MVTRGAGPSLGPEVARHSPWDRFTMALDFHIYGISIASRQNHRGVHGVHIGTIGRTL